jgi:hypothetical protein
VFSAADLEAAYTPEAVLARFRTVDSGKGDGSGCGGELEPWEALQVVPLPSLPPCTAAAVLLLSSYWRGF